MQKVVWLEEEDVDKTSVVSSGISLARRIRIAEFIGKMSAKQFHKI